MSNISNTLHSTTNYPLMATLINTSITPEKVFKRVVSILNTAISVIDNLTNGATNEIKTYSTEDFFGCNDYITALESTADKTLEDLPEGTDPTKYKNDCFYAEALSSFYEFASVLLKKYHSAETKSSYKDKSNTKDIINYLITIIQCCNSQKHKIIFVKMIVRMTKNPLINVIKSTYFVANHAVMSFRHYIETWNDGIKLDSNNDLRDSTERGKDLFYTATESQKHIYTSVRAQVGWIKTHCC